VREEADGPLVTVVPAAQRGAALQVLYARQPADERAARVAEILAGADAGRFSLDGLLGVEEAGRLVGVGLTVPQPDGITLFWPPIVLPQARNADAVEEALLRRATQDVDATPAKLAQMLLDPSEIPETTCYRRHGFVQSTDLFFLARSSAEPLPSVDLGDLELEAFAGERNAGRFAAVLEATYAGTRDCPWLEGLRTGAEALASHQMAGVWRREWWWLARAEGRDTAVLLINDHPDQDAAELVYFGVVPAARGRGYGRRLLAYGLQAVRERTAIFLAVDAENSFANAIYAELGFVEVARRRALFRFPGGLARE
jgi:ribosomal protein S18 acetylase RimI-like enzyme